MKLQIDLDSIEEVGHIHLNGVTIPLSRAYGIISDRGETSTISVAKTMRDEEQDAQGAPLGSLDKSGDDKAAAKEGSVSE
jgi:hypothetical protein